MIRRLTGLLMCSLVLQLNFRASDLACAKHVGESTSKAQTSSAQHHGMAMPAQGEQQAATEQRSCEIPATKDCCLALISCALTLASEEDAGIRSAVRTREVAPKLTADVPVSLIRAPEPPPPRL
jgi:hypothetical protein